MMAEVREAGTSGTEGEMNVRMRRSSAESAAEPLSVSMSRDRRQLTGPRNAATDNAETSFWLTRNPELELGFQLPDGERGATAQPESRPHLAEVALQAQTIPARGPQMHVGIRSHRIAVPLPVAPGQGAEVQRAAAEPPEVAERAGGLAVAEILQHVVADHQIERGGTAIFLDAAMLPAVAAAKVGAGLQADLLGSRQEALERGMQQARAAAGIEQPADRQADVLGERRDQTRAGLHFAAGRDGRARIVVVTPVVLAIEGLLRELPWWGFLSAHGSGWTRSVSRALTSASRRRACGS